MVSWSALGRSFGKILAKNHIKSPFATQNVAFSTTNALKGDHRTFAMQPSRWQWDKFKDMAHYYFMIGLIPVTGIIFYSNVFIGPAQLQPIPDDYVPKHWEYHRHPITRFIARYVHNNPQQVATDKQQCSGSFTSEPFSFQCLYHFKDTAISHQEYEKFMHWLDEEKQRMKLRQLEKDIIKKMGERQDYQAYYYKPMVNKYLRINKQTGEELYERLGDNYEE